MTDELPDEQLEDLHAKRDQLLARLHAVQARGRYAHEKSWGTLREERMEERLQVLEGKMLWELRGLDQRIRDLAAKAEATFTERDFIFKGEWDWFMERVREFWNGPAREEDARRVVRLFAHGAQVAVIGQLQTVAPGRIRLRVRSPEAAPAVEEFWAALRRNADISEEIEVAVLAPVWTFSGGWDYFVKDWRAAAAQVDLPCRLDKERDELTMDTPTGREATLTAGARTDAATQLYWEVAAHDWVVMNGKDGKVAAIVAMLRRRGWVVVEDTQAGDQAEPTTAAAGLTESEPAAPSQTEDEPKTAPDDAAGEPRQPKRETLILVSLFYVLWKKGKGRSQDDVIDNSLNGDICSKTARRYLAAGWVLSIKELNQIAPLEELLQLAKLGKLKGV